MVLGLFRDTNPGRFRLRATELEFPFRSPHLGIHVSRSLGDIYSETRIPENYRGSRRGTQVSLSSRNNFSETRTLELEISIGPWVTFGRWQGLASQVKFKVGGPGIFFRRKFLY